MFYVLYQVTNMLTGKIYIGVHETANIHDNYMGSGDRIRAALRKYGRSNFRKDIRAVFESREDLYSAEKELVNDSFLARRDVYNIVLGGSQGSLHLKDPIEGRKIWQKGRKRFEELLLDPSFNAFYRKRLSEGRKEYFKNHAPTFKGRKHTAASKKKISESAKTRSGKKHSTYGKCWIYNLDLKLSKMVDAKIYLKYTQNGWLKGRKIKW